MALGLGQIGRELREGGPAPGIDAGQSVVGPTTHVGPGPGLAQGVNVSGWGPGRAGPSARAGKWTAGPNDGED